MIKNSDRRMCSCSFVSLMLYTILNELVNQTQEMYRFTFGFLWFLGISVLSDRIRGCSGWD